MVVEITQQELKKASELLKEEARESCRKYLEDFYQCTKGRNLTLYKCRSELSQANVCVKNYGTNERLPLLGKCPFSPELSFCQSESLSHLPQCRLGTVENENLKTYFILEKLLREPFFRYFKVDLKKDCPYWDSALICFSDQCAIEVLPEEPEFIPKFQPLLSGDVDSLNDVKFPKFQQNIKLFEKFEKEEGFCSVDNDDCEGVYVDLIENPERFTGYSGPAAHKIWETIYNEDYMSDRALQDAQNWYSCDERKFFYRIVSGLHASISVHLSDRYYNRKLNRWESSFQMFHDRVGAHIERVQNMYLTYTLLLRAVYRIKSKMQLVQFGVNENDVNSAKQLVESLYRNIPKYPKGFDKNFLAVSPTQATRLKATFRNMAKLMDCVSCERCRLWGKVQIYGVGTALKVLTSDNLKTTKFTRGEIVTLFNAFGRLSESLVSTHNFRDFYAVDKQITSQELNEYSSFRIICAVFITILSISLVYFLRFHRICIQK